MTLDPLRLEDSIARRSEARAPDPHRRGRGQVFTPPRLAELVCGATLDGLGPGPLRVLDPAAGDGRFLAAAAAVAGERGVAVDLIGIERDAELAAACRERVAGAEVHTGEALFEVGDRVAGARGVDAVIGNPPYVRSIRLREADPALWARLRGALSATAHGEWDLYGAFVERSLAWVRPGGRVGLIVPSRWLTAVWARGLRGALAAAGAVRTVVDFGAAQVFPDATTYASVVILERGARAAPVEVVRRGQRGWQRATLDVAALGDRPWIVGAPARRGSGRRRIRDRGAALALGDVARIAKGTGTNADPVFVIEDAVVDGARVRGTAGGEPVELETAATVPCLRGRDVRGAGQRRAAVRCLVPYRDGRLIAWPELEATWPLAAAHLLRHRARLEARERGRFAGDAFHCFGRPQNLAFHLDRAPKVVVPDVARTARAVLDDSGALVLDTAYAVRPLPGAPAPWHDPAALLALLSSPALFEWLARASVPLRGDYRRLKTAFLAPMPLPESP